MNDLQRAGVTTTAQRNRVQWIDYARGICILGVVFAHVWWGICSAEFTKTKDGVELFIDLTAVVTMPFFFFVSGMLIANTLAKPPGEFLVDRLKSLAYPYIVWALLHGLILIVVGKLANSAEPVGNLWTLTFHPRWHYWFLYVLLFVQVIHYGLHRLGMNTKVFFAVCLLFLATMNIQYVSLDFWDVLYQVRRYIAYYAMGAFMGPKGPINRLNDWPVPALAGMAVIGFPMTMWMVWVAGEDIAAVNIAMAVIGSLALASVSILLSRLPAMGFIATWGNRSLEIYVAHVIALAGTRIVLLKVFGIDSVPVHLILGMIAGMYVPIGLYWASTRLGFPYFFSLKVR